MRLVLFLLLGAIVNVAVAWGSAAMLGFSNVVHSMRGYRSSSTGFLSVEVYCRPSAQRIALSRLRESRPAHAEGPEPTKLVPTWVSMSQDLPDDTTHLFWDVEARGMPCLALWSTTEQWSKSSQGEPRVGKPSGSIRLPLSDFAGGMGYIPRVLPLRPIWPGFAINTVFYAATLWMLFAAPGMVKRRIRRLRGRCIHCGYDLRGQPPPEDGDSIRCPECGRSA